MKRKILLLIVFVCLECFGEDIKMDVKIEKGINYYFSEIIPKYYQGQKEFNKEKKILTEKFGLYMMGQVGLSVVGDTDNLITNFYYLVNNKRQDHQVIKITEQNVNEKLYEYWIMNMSDHGTPYDYSYFYLTEAESKQGERAIIDCSKQYKETYIISDDEILDLSFNNIIVLYQSTPWLSRQSFKGTRYEDKIVKWKGDTPSLRSMNIFEKMYFKNLNKSKK